MRARRHLLLLGVLLLVQLGMVSLQVRSGEPSGGGVLFKLFAPVARAGSAVVDGAASLWNGYIDLRGARAEADHLSEEVRRLRLEVDGLHEVARQNERLHRLLAMKSERGWDEALGARVVALNREPLGGTLILNRGSRHGVRTDLPVVTADGVVGRVIATGSGTSKVQLLTDPSAGVAVVFERSRDHATGIAAGGAGSRLQVRYVSTLADVRPGDLARTSGLEGIYPPGLPVGVVHTVQDRADLMKEIEMVPTVPFGRLEEVLVLLSPGTLGAGPEEREPDPERDPGGDGTGQGDTREADLARR